MDGAGCLVLLGMLLFLPAFFYSLVVAGFLVWQAVSEIRASTLRELPGLLRAWLDHARQWMTGRSTGGSGSPILVLFLTAYFLLFWQWVAFLMRWHPRLSTPRLWAISSAYFVAAMLAFTISAWPSNSSGITAESGAFGEWFLKTIAFSVLGGTFLCASVSLWVMSARARARSARILASRLPPSE